MYIPDHILDPDFKSRPVRRNDTYRMLGHILRVTTVKTTNRTYDNVPERRVFLTCAKDCNCGGKFLDHLLFPVKLEILERHLEKVTLDKF